MKKYIVTSMVSLALVLTAAGCGTNGGNSTSGSGAQKTFTFGMSGKYPPFNYKDKNGKLTGFDVAIGDAIAKQMGMKPKPVTNPWATIIGGLKAKKYDAIVGSMTITKAREKEVSFSKPYYVSGTQIFVKAGNNSVTSLQGLKNKRIGVDTGSTFAKIAKTVTTQAKVHGYSSDVYALKDLAAGRLDGVITDQLVGQYAIKHSHIKVQPAGKPLNLAYAGIAVRKSDTSLLTKINKALKAIEKNGTYAKISKQYFGVNLLNDPAFTKKS
ncbi:transporter substrate-binding domain-containing protein [Alicyclobacillus sp. SO9]|uniref:transporter substrate-binding domain-containing protein n=1 Tax=Alicyclobacillus sp. SO9 TaxID=2665646 RepID=UPI0018E8800D|nr:transporter substrate-binding domain-containing protein [Alicyclobacillus sp. SO9]QQE79777.1 transporter substrate-binding domain-containing protein [Alicyclobacillus sp. SO9]